MRRLPRLQTRGSSHVPEAPQKLAGGEASPRAGTTGISSGAISPRQGRWRFWRAFQRALRDAAVSFGVFRWLRSQTCFTTG